MVESDTPDGRWIVETRAIEDPMELLVCIVENQDFLGYDPYYSDLRAAMLDTAEKLVDRAKGDSGEGVKNDTRG